MATIPRSKTPHLLQMLQWVFNPLGYIETNVQRLGDLFGAAISPTHPDKTILVNHPEAIRFLLTRDNSEEITAPGEVNALVEPIVGKHSIFLLNGQHHRQRRKLMMPPFHGDRMRGYGAIIRKVTKDVISEWQTEQTFCVRDAMQKITMRVILQAVFGLYEGDRYRRLEQLLAERLNMISSPLTSFFVFFPQLLVDLGPRSPGGRIRRIVEEIDQLLYAEIRERRARLDLSCTDVLSLLLSARDEGGQGLTDEELHDELITLLMAGHETTATALAWALYWIYRIPHVREALMQELEPWQNSDDLETIARLPYLTAVCNETLRIYPVGLVTLPRRIEKPLQVMEYDLEVGSLPMGCIYAVHHREDLYPNSHEFRPERFLERQFSAYEFLPFGGGVRRCIGAAFAMYEMKLVLHTILEHCELELATSKAVKPKRRGGTLAPGGGVSMRKVSDRPLKRHVSNEPVGV